MANQALSERRVDAVLAELKKRLGDAAASITFTVDHRGATEPAADLAKSRRVTIEIQK